MQCIEVDVDNTKYCSVDGVLYDKELKTILRYPEKKDSFCYVILDGIKSIGKKAFWGCESLKSVEIPSGVVTVGDFAFAYCFNLNNMNIPDSVLSIGISPFQDCI